MEMTVSDGLMAALVVQLVIVIGLPILLLVRWYKHTHAPMLPAVVGMVIYMIFVQALQQILHGAFLLSSNPISKAINGSPWLYALYVGLAAGLFEETGRFMGFKYLLRRYPQRETAISYGIGHGGYECLAIAGLTTLSYLILAAFINSGTVPTILEMYPAQQADLIEEILAQVAQITTFECIWSSIERVVALVMQISLSVLVFVSVQQAETRGSYYLIAIVLHMLTGISAGLYQAGILSGNRGMVAAILLNLLVTLVAVFLARRSWRQLPEPTAPDTSEKPNFPM